ncbi:MAG: transposase [Bacteroidales bacterium]|nr:transposase [Bacteroidales bacterium]
MNKQEPFQAGYYYHVFNRGNNHEKIFLETQNYHYFLFLTKKYLHSICKVFAYCLIPNHFHFLLRIKDTKDLPVEYINGNKKLHQPFSNFFNAYSKAINKKYHRRGSLFQEHLKRDLIVGETHFMNMVLYIHLNPEHHCLKESFDNYPFSSYRVYTCDVASFVDENYTLELFGGIENFIYTHNQRKYDLELLKNEESWDGKDLTGF